MADNFITHIHVYDSRNVTDFDIPLSETERKHLIITGKNGSGKTSLLEEISKQLNFIANSPQSIIANAFTITKGYHEDKIPAKRYEQEKKRIGGLIISFTDHNSLFYFDDIKNTFINVFFGARRRAEIAESKGIAKLDLPAKTTPDTNAGKNFLQFIVNLKAERSFARDDSDMETVAQIDAWFDMFTASLRELYDDQDLELQFEGRGEYNFKIVPSKGIPFDFFTLSDGYSSIIGIISDLIMRMEANKADAYNMEGIVLIDEIETHLHVDLQKKILPFLTRFFPRIQFIIASHSPFILSSLPNSVICDLEKRTVVSDLSAYSYDALVESYFSVDKYSEEVKRKIAEYEALIDKEDKSIDDTMQLRHYEEYFATAPKYLSPELRGVLQQLNIKKKTAK